MGPKMTSISGLHANTAALFAAQSKAAKPNANAALQAAVQKAVELKAAELKAMAARSSAASPAPAQNYWEQYSPESLAAAEAAFEKWEAGEQQFAAENGFRRLVNSGLLGMYAHAKTGVFGTAQIANRTDLNDLLGRFFTGFQSDVAHINQNGGGSLTVGGPFQGYVEKGLGERGTAVFIARSQDYLDARRITLYAETAYVQKSLGLSQPIVTERDGKVSFTEQTILLHGKAFAKIGTDGGLTLLAGNPDARHPDPVDLYQPLNLQV